MNNATKILIMSTVIWVSVAIAQADVFGTGENQFTIDFVTISGDASSANGTAICQHAPHEGGYKTFTDPISDYRVGTFEITNDQWNKFRASYGPLEGLPVGAYTNDPYWTDANVPTNMVSWYEAARFVNWLNTSTGHQPAYKFTGTPGHGHWDYVFETWSSTEAANGTNLYRHKDAVYFLPTENEWVKAAYWNGTNLQTWANASPNDLVSSLPDPAKWNYDSSSLDQPWNVDSGVKELNGTYNMMGNVWEWMESPIEDTSYQADSGRGMRGGAYGYDNSCLASSYRGGWAPFGDYAFAGFRVAAVIPEPSGLVFSILASFVILINRR